MLALVPTRTRAACLAENCQQDNKSQKHISGLAERNRSKPDLTVGDSGVVVTPTAAMLICSRR